MKDFVFFCIEREEVRFNRQEPLPQGRFSRSGFVVRAYQRRFLFKTGYSRRGCQRNQGFKNSSFCDT